MYNVQIVVIFRCKTEYNNKTINKTSMIFGHISTNQFYFQLFKVISYNEKKTYHTEEEF